MKFLTTEAQALWSCLRRLFRPGTGLESGGWDRAYLCSMAPLSADALRHNEEAARSHGHAPGF